MYIYFQERPLSLELLPDRKAYPNTARLHLHEHIYVYIISYILYVYDRKETYIVRQIWDVKRKGERKKAGRRGGWHDGINLFIYSAGAGGDLQPA
jgi:hypothetical protein